MTNFQTRYMRIYGYSTMSQPGWKWDYEPRESLLKENTLGKESLLFQQFSFCCFVVRVNFSYKTQE